MSTSNASTAAGDISLPEKHLHAQQISKILHDPLGISLPTNVELDQLFATFAPIWEVDVADENDQIGKVD